MDKVPKQYRPMIDGIVSVPSPGSLCFHALSLSGSTIASAYAPPPNRRPRLDLSYTSTKNDQSQAMPPTGNFDLQRVPTAQSDYKPEPQESLSSATDSAFLATRSQMRSTEATRNVTSRPLVVSVGGIDLHSIDADTPGRCVLAYDEKAEEWQSVTSLHSYMHHHGSCSINGKLYVVGGAVYDSSNPEQLGSATRTLQMYDPESNTWSRLSDMGEPRAYVGVASYAGYVYAVGGEDDERRKLDTIERYDPLLGTWSYVARMPGGGRIGAAVATHRGQLYIIGGYRSSRQSNPVMADVLCFDLTKESWVPKTPLIIPRCHASAIDVKGRLFLIGGRTKLDGRQPPISSLSLVEVYDDVNDAWDHVTDLAVPRHDAGCAAIGTHLYILGGMKTPSPFCLRSIEVLDVETGSWLDDAIPLPYPSTGVACCTLNIPAQA